MEEISWRNRFVPYAEKAKQQVPVRQAHGWGGGGYGRPPSYLTRSGVRGWNRGEGSNCSSMHLPFLQYTR